MSNQPQPSSADQEITPEQVAQFLRAHPSFFVEHEYLLKEIKLPHASGAAISLVERQLSLFREQRDRYESQLFDLIDTARENDRFFEKSKRLLMNLLDAKALDEVKIVLQDSFLNDFKLDYCNLVLLARREDFPVTNLEVVTREELIPLFQDDLLAKGKPHIGQLSEEQSFLLFGAESDQVKSAAVMPVRHGDAHAVLCIGSREPDYFHDGLDSLFITYICEALGRILPALMANELGSQMLVD